MTLLSEFLSRRAVVIGDGEATSSSAGIDTATDAMARGDILALRTSLTALTARVVVLEAFHVVDTQVQP